MADYQTVIKNSQSIVDLLAAQCEDLESLLSLAREEAEAAKKGDFLSIVDIVSERARIGERLETFQRQTVLLKENLVGEAGIRSLTQRSIEAARLTIEQDRTTRDYLSKLQTSSRDQAVSIGRGKTSLGLYAKTEQKGLVCDQAY